VWAISFGQNRPENETVPPVWGSTGFKEGKEGRPREICSGSIKSYPCLEKAENALTV
jgi:hypothetical protein